MSAPCSSANNGCATCAPEPYLFSIEVGLTLDMNQISYTCPQNGDENNPPTCYAGYNDLGNGIYSQRWESPCDEGNIAYNSTSRGGSYSLAIQVEGKITPDGDIYGSSVYKEKGDASYSLKQTLWPNFGCSPRGSEDWTENSSYSIIRTTDSCGNVQGIPIYTVSKSRAVQGPDGGSSLETVNGCRNIFDGAGNFIEAVADYYLQECGFWGCQEYTGLIQCGIPYCCDGPTFPCYAENAQCSNEEVFSRQVTMGMVENAVSSALNKQIEKTKINASYSCANKKIATGRTNFCGNPGDKEACWSIGFRPIDSQTRSEESLIADRSVGRVSNSLYQYRISFKKNDLQKNIQSISGKVYFYLYDEYPPIGSPCCNSCDCFNGDVLGYSVFTVDLGSTSMIKDGIEYVYSDLDYIFDYLETSKSHPEKWIASCTSIEKIEYF